ncbi:MAG: ABC transporter permease [Chloroflexota bacterium]|nr:ABC transporter permease [Chloroflexota bacterium]
MNGRLSQVFWYELRRNFRRTGYLFTTFGVPVLVFVASMVLPVLLSGLGNQERSTDITEPNLPTEIMEQADLVGYVDATGRFSEPGELSDSLIRYEDEAAAQAALTAGEIDTYYLIPADYFDTGDVTLVMPRLMINLIDNDLIEQLLLRELASGVAPEVFTRLEDPLNMREVDTQRATSTDSESAFDSRFLIAYIFAIILMGSLFLTNGYLLQTVIEEKETRLIEILLSTMRPFDLLAGKIAALGLLGILQMLVWGGAFAFTLWLSTRETLRAILPALGVLVNLTIPLDIIPLLIVYFILGYLLFAALFGVVGALSNSMREGPQYAVIFTLPAFVPFYFISLFATAPNGTLPVILSLFPLTAPLSMAQRLAVSEVPGWQLALSIALLALSVVGVMWLAGRLFRVNTLLAGNLPKLRELPKLLRG